jgi:alkanesulfonate monooxygenase SsuD/methylene tetrahydromethanopterin reductase-like flavin-dependent oxidoreductase (luciferase family)
VKHGFVLPYGDARSAAELAAIAEEHGWDAFFVWEGVWSIDPWVSLAAAAMRTEHILLGTMLTPIPRRRPWELASQTATLDNLSGGRVILPVGLGVPIEAGPRWWLFEDDPGRRVRAELLDEGLAMLEHLWRGQAFSYDGAHYRTIRQSDEILPPPAVQPRIPVWVVGAWPRMKSMRRAARWDGWLPTYLPVDHSGYAEMTPEVLAEAVAWIRDQRASAGLSMDSYAVTFEGATPADDPAAAAAKVRPWFGAGANWWIEADWSEMDPDKVRQSAEHRLRAGPPR